MLTGKEYTQRRNAITGELWNLDLAVRRRVADVHARGLALKKKLPDQGETIGKWEKGMIDKIQQESAAARRSLNQARNDLDKQWQRQQIQDSASFVRELAAVLGAENKRDAILARLREMMASTPVVINPFNTTRELVEVGRVERLERELSRLRQENERLKAERFMVFAGRIKGRDGKIEPIRVTDTVTVIPPGCEGGYDEERVPEAEPAGDPVDEKIEALNRELFDKVRDYVQ